MLRWATTRYSSYADNRLAANTCQSGVVTLTDLVHSIDHGRKPGLAGVLQLASDGGDSQWYMNTYHMTLQSDAHKEAPVLVCGGAYNYAFSVRYPSLQEMLAALGDYAVLKLH